MNYLFCWLLLLALFLKRSRNSLSLGSMDPIRLKHRAASEAAIASQATPKRFESLLDRSTILYTAPDLSDGLDGTV
jgi:hypothetical protein